MEYEVRARRVTGRIARAPESKRGQNNLFASCSLKTVLIPFPPLQRAFATVPLRLIDWLECFVAASSVLWLSELAKLVGHVVRPL